MNRFVIAILLLLVWAVPASANIDVVTRSGITVTFSGSPTSGTYANGDYWVAVGGGSTTIVTRTNAGVTGRHGCQVNVAPHAPGTDWTAAKTGKIQQGFDSRAPEYFYNVSLNVCATLPSAAFSAGSSLLFATSGNPTGTCPLDSGSITCLSAVDVVTIVSSGPACGNDCGWRPPFAGTDKSLPTGLTNNKSVIRYNVLPDWTNLGGISSLAAIETTCWFRGPLMILAGVGANGWTDELPNSDCNTPIVGYGRQIQQATVNVMASLAQNATDGQKEVVAIRMAQTAIDLYGQYRAGQYFVGLAGWCWPAKEIILFGASLLDNAEMMAIGNPAVSGNKFCTNYQYHTITQADINTTMQSSCGSNLSTDTTKCVDFTQPHLGLAQWCADWNVVSKCSAIWNPTYAYQPVTGPVGIAVILSRMNLEEEHGNPAYFQYLLNRNNAWGDNRIMSLWRSAFTGECFTASPTTQNNPDDTSCELYDSHIADTQTDGSLSGVVSTPNEPPTNALVSPSSALTHYTSSATISLAGTATDSDGTVTGTVCASDKDGTIVNSGTATAWACVPDLPSMSVSAITVTSYDDDVASVVIPLSVLRVSSTCTGLADTFTLSGTWTTPNPYCWVNMVGSLSWTNNHLQSAANSRNFYYFNSAINNDQMASVTIDTTPTDNVWIYQGIRGSVSGALYSGMGCTAQNPISYIAKFINTNRTTFATIDMTTTPWVAGDVASCRVIGQQYCLLKNGVVQGSCATDGVSSFTSGFTWAGAWGSSTGFSNFVATSQAGGGDIISPLAAITTPAGVLQVAATPYTLMAGTFSDAVGVATATWIVAENPSENGTVTPSPALPATSGTWTIPGGGIDLISGNNTVQATFTDADGNQTTVSQIINYVPASSVVATFTYPNADATWTQNGRLVDLMGTFTAAQCTSVLLTNITDPNPVVGGTQVVATGTDSWSARVGLLQYRDEFGAVSGLNDIVISCMSGAAGTGTSLLDVHKFVTYIPLKKRR